MIRVRPAVPGDAAALAEIEEKSTEQPWTEGQIEEELGYPFAVLLAAEIGDIPAGMLDMHVTAPAAYINEISVDPGMRRQGIGTALLKAALEECRKRGCNEILLDVRSRNSGARSFYRKFGFTELCVRKNMYRDPDDDGITMRYKID
ncbi:MAG: ribosomal protein S18-alanine N-acetyltransferase [Oscillospiraceae bacterium]|jgi:ribosomal-protein-alanine N-acetyltransferase